MEGHLHVATTGRSATSTGTKSNASSASTATYRVPITALKIDQSWPIVHACFLLGGGARGSHGTERAAGERAGQISLFSFNRYPVLRVCVRCFVVVERPFCQKAELAVAIGSGRPARPTAPGPNPADGRTPPLTPRITRHRSSPPRVCAWAVRRRRGGSQDHCRRSDRPPPATPPRAAHTARRGAWRGAFDAPRSSD